MMGLGVDVIPFIYHRSLRPQTLRPMSHSATRAAAGEPPTPQRPHKSSALKTYQEVRRDPKHEPPKSLGGIRTEKRF